MNINNLELYKETKLISSLRTIFYKIIVNKDFLFLYFDIKIILIIMKVIYYNEEKRREIYISGGQKIKIDFTKNGFYEVENELKNII